MVQLFWACFFDSYSFPIDSYSFLFVSYSLPIHFLFIFSHFLSSSMHSYLFPIHCLFIFFSFHSFLSFPLTWEIYQNSKKQGYVFLINLLLKNYWFQAPNQLGKGVPHKSPKKWLIKGVVNKVLGLDGLLISYSILIHFLFNSFSFPIQILFMSYSTLIETPFIPTHFSAFHFQRFSIKVINKGW